MIKLEHVWKEYKIDNEVTFTALKDVSLTIEQGELTSIIGPSGCGKSTLMHLIGLLDKPSQGNVFIDGKLTSGLNDNEISVLRSEFVGFVFQQFNLISKLTVLENVLLPTIYLRGILPYKPTEKAKELLEQFGLGSKLNSYPNKISGGQQQRVAIARALILNPQLILADEPTGNLDSKTGDDIINLLIHMNKTEKRTIVIVTHEPDIAARTKRKISIKDGEIVS